MPAAKRDKKKWQGQGGFTLVEMLASLLVIALIAVIMAGGIPLVLKAYNNVVSESDARLLLSTTMNELRNELANATDIRIGADGLSVEYQSSQTGAVSRISLEDGQIVVTRFRGYDSGTGDHVSRPLVSEMAATNNLKAVYEGISEKAPGIICVSGLKVTGRDGNERCSAAEYLIRNFASR